MLIDVIKPKNFTHFLELILCNFLTLVCESSTHDLCVFPLQICKVKCDWFLSADVMEIELEFADVIFGADKRQPEIRLRSQAIAAAVIVLWLGGIVSVVCSIT